MKTSTKILILILITFAHFFSTIAIANDDDPKSDASYSFNGRVYKLDQFKDQEPNMTPPPKADISELKVDLLKFQTEVKNQDDRGSCAYFSSTALIESAIKLKQKIDVNLSEEYIIQYGKEVKNQAPDGDGSSSYYNLRNFQDGFLLEKDVPYAPSWFKKGLACEDYVDDKKNAPHYCFSHYAPKKHLYEMRLNKNNSSNLIVESIHSNSTNVMYAMAEWKQSVVVGLPVHHDGWDAKTGYCYYNEELRKKCNATEGLCGGHSVVLVGYDREKRLFTFKNSWGHDWGKKGYGTISFDFLNRYASGQAQIARFDEDSSDINFPTNHNKIVQAKIKNISVISKIEDENIVVNLNADISYMISGTIYASTYIEYQNDPQSKMMTLTTKSGHYASGKFYKTLLNTEEIKFNELNGQIQMRIPLKTISTRKLKNKDTFLRVSVYFYSDTGSWKKIYREFRPFFEFK